MATGKTQETQSERTPVAAQDAGAGRERLLALHVIGDGFMSTFPLPPSGEIVIGRAADADLRIDHASISRRHAILRTGDALTIEDLASVNGTRVGEVRIAPGERAPITMGDVVEVGSTTLVIQYRSTATRPRRIWTHGYFEGRVADECARANHNDARFALLRLRVSAAVSPSVVQELVFDKLRPGDVLASYGPNDYEALLVDADPEDARELASALHAAFAHKSALLRLGLACHPQDGRDPDVLMYRACDALDGRSGGDAGDAPIIVEEGEMQRLHALIARVATATIPILLTGETGVGKDVFAVRIHALSPRTAKPLMCLNCATFSESLIESELFGHERGAFTGADQVKPGLFEAAAGGTVFLDEIGELSLPLQAKLLRVFEDRCVMRVGALSPRAIDVRFIAATNRDLEADVRHGRFREDLFYRLNGMTLYIPPLRERPYEIAPLAHAFVARASRAAGRSRDVKISSDAMTKLASYSWPGNIRELRNVIERAVLLTTTGMITPEHLPLEKMRATMELPARPVDRDPIAEPLAVPPVGPTSPTDLKTGLDAYERQAILDALHEALGNQTVAARRLGISRRTLVNRMKAFGLRRPRSDDPS